MVLLIHFSSNDGNILLYTTLIKSIYEFLKVMFFNVSVV